MTVARSDVATPARGTRPRNRRALILAAAGELFYTHGYDHVGTSDLAEAVGIGPSALYRHFPSKQHVLSAVVFDGLVPTRELLSRLDLTDTDGAFRQLAGLALDQRRIGVLWDRESRSMAAEDRRALRVEITAIAARMAELVATARPELNPAAADLLGRCLLAVFVSPSFHHLELARPAFEALLRDAAHRVLAAPVQGFDGTPAPRAADPLAPSSRREAILDEATRLFARNGYAGVSIEDIAAALGIAGASVYNHFASKLDILVTALTRGTSYLMLDLSEVLSQATDPATALTGLLDSYLHLATAHHDILDLLITTSGQLPEDQRRQSRQVQLDYISEWTRLLAMVEPDAQPTALRIRVQAALTIVNDTARTPHLLAADGYVDAIRATASRLIVTPPASSGAGSR